MFNLLPESLKDRIKKEYNLRRLIVGFFFILFLQTAFFIFMLPSWMISKYKEETSSARVIQLDNSELLSNSNAIRPVIRSINAELILIDRSLEYPKISPYLDSILSMKTNSIKINQFSFSPNSTSTETINLQGVSATRDSLVNFKKSLDESGLFKSIDLPVSNFTKDKNISFNMTLTVAK
jgi:hypothetical protein